MVCKQKQIDKNPFSPTYNEERIVDVQCPPNTPCLDSSVCVGTLFVTLSCLPNGQIKIIVNSSLTGLRYRINSSNWQENNQFLLNNLPEDGYLVEIYQISTGCIKSVNSGYISCSIEKNNDSELIFLRTQYNNYYCQDSITIFAVETINVYLDQLTGLEVFKTVSIEGQGIC